MSDNQLDKLQDSGLLSIRFRDYDAKSRIGRDDAQEFIDFCSCNYLGYDAVPSVSRAGIAAAEKWSTLSGWSRLEAEFDVYQNVDHAIGQMLGVQRVYTSHSITATAMSLIPLIVGKTGCIFADSKVHSVIWEACRLARDHGAGLQKWQHQNVDELGKLLAVSTSKGPKLVVVDGVYSIGAALAPIAELQALCQRYDAWLFVDDAHGFGILGSEPTASNPWGSGGGGAVLHAGCGFDRIFYCSSFGKAFCTSTAFCAIPRLFPERVENLAMTNLFSAPLSPYTAGTVLEVIRQNSMDGDARRKQIAEKVRLFTSGLQQNGIEFEANLGQPIVFVKIGTIDHLVAAGKVLKRHGILTGLRPYPVVPKDRCGFRFAIHALHSIEQITKAIDALAEATSVTSPARQYTAA